MSTPMTPPTSVPTAQKCSEGNTDTSEHRDRKKYRAFCMAIFDFDKVKFNEDTMKYFCYAPETCPTTGRSHWQAYVYFKNPKTISAAAKAMGCGVEVAYGSPKQNKQYIEGPYEKDGKKKDRNPEFQEYGDFPSQGARNDLIELQDSLKGSKRTVDDILDNDPYMFHLYGRTLERMEAMYRPTNIYYKKPEVVWLYGPTGTGKTLRAIQAGCVPIQYKDGFYTNWGNARKVVFDEFRGQIPYAEMLNICDGYHNAYRLNIKNGYKFVDFDVIYVCSPLPPEGCYPRQLEKADNINQLLRRITTIEHLTSQFEYVDLDTVSDSGSYEATIPLSVTRIDEINLNHNNYNQRLNNLYCADEDDVVQIVDDE